MMRKTMLLFGLMALAAPAVEAGGPPGRGGMDARRGEIMGRLFGAMRDRREEADAFDAARRYFDLTDEQRLALDALNAKQDAEERQALAELNARLVKKYAPQIAALLPEAERAKFEALMAAMLERDEKIEAAREALLTVLEQVRAAQGVPRDDDNPNRIPSGKADIIRRYIKLSEEQRTRVDAVRRDTFTMMREEMRNVPRPEDWRNAEARRRFAEGMRTVLAAADDQSATAMLGALNDEQKKAYETAAEALAAYRTATAEADEAFQKKLVELVGEERARAPRGRGFGPPGGGRPQRGGAGGEAPRRGEDF